MKKTIEVVNQLETEGIINGYALGGATALLFYAEPALTFDIDIFIFLPNAENSTLIDLGPLYQALRDKGYESEKEHMMIAGIPVQFIPVYNDLVREAVHKAGLKNYEGVSIKVIQFEYLLAIMVDTNRPKDRERIGQLIHSVPWNQKVLYDILDRYSLLERFKKLK